MCISSIQQLNKDSIEFFLLTQTRSSSKVILFRLYRSNKNPSVSLEDLG